MTIQTPAAAHQAFLAFAHALGIGLVLTRGTKAAFIPGTEYAPPTLLVPEGLTPEQQGQLGATLARIVYGRESAA